MLRDVVRNHFSGPGGKQDKLSQSVAEWTGATHANIGTLILASLSYSDRRPKKMMRCLYNTTHTHTLFRSRVFSNFIPSKIVRLDKTAVFALPLRIVLPSKMDPYDDKVTNMYSWEITYHHHETNICIV